MTFPSGQGFDYYRQFLAMSIEEQNNELNTKPPQFWDDIGAKKAMETFQAASQRVPAYRKFLNQHRIAPNDIKSAEDFRSVPIITKENYLTKYPLEDLCWDGDLTVLNVISVSSGTTGVPFFWPRDIWQEREVDHWYGLTYRYLFKANDTNSLVIICFAMGMYIAGPFTFASSLRIAEKGYPMAIATPGTNFEAILALVKGIGAQFDQIIIGGYPPLIKEVLDLGERDGIDWKRYNTKLFFGGEAFSEHWRERITNVIGAKSLLDSAINMYGTADSALLGIETPTSITFRKQASEDKSFASQNFSNDRIPSIVSYNPLFKFFESADDTLLFTSSSGIPLIRYNIGDAGGIIRYSQAVSSLISNGRNLEDILADSKLSHSNWRLPLVYLFGRSDFTVQLYGANIYPENIKEGLDDQRINKYVSGKFKMAIEYGNHLDPCLDLVVELAPKIEPKDYLVATITRVLTEVLRKSNSEYHNTHSVLKEKAHPKVTLQAYGHEMFKINIKHRWVPKNG